MIPAERLRWDREGISGLNGLSQGCWGPSSASGNTSWRGASWGLQRIPQEIPQRDLVVLLDCVGVSNDAALC